ncbi:MAG: hypothetical protein CSB21_03350 [Deltaproteobacteria bacterium]|nr:MAG: hypothetical protein CSB21_03350 [Deltaproteobacteria bacterium]
MNKKEALLFFIKKYLDPLQDNERINELSKFCHFGRIKRNNILFLEQEKGSSAYFLTSGRIKLIRTNKEGKEVIATFITPGQLIAWFALMTEGSYPVTAVALQESEYLAFDISHLRHLVEMNPHFASRLFEYVAKRQRFLLNSIKELALSEPKIRLLNYLEHLHQQCGSSTIALPDDKKQIALLLGVSPETLSRIFRKLIDESYIEVQGKNIRLLRMPKPYKEIY